MKTTKERAPLRECLSLGEYLELCKKAIQREDRNGAIEIIEEIEKGVWTVGANRDWLVLKEVLFNINENPVA